MEMQFSLDNIGPSLWLMLLGMVGIFVVMGVILLSVYLLKRRTTAIPSSKPPVHVKGTLI